MGKWKIYIIIDGDQVGSFEEEFKESLDEGDTLEIDWGIPEGRVKDGPYQVIEAEGNVAKISPV